MAKVCGPIPLYTERDEETGLKMFPRGCGKQLEQECRDVGVENRRGCYLFATQHGRSFRPWYVGKSTKRPVVRESMNGRNRYIYTCALYMKPKSKPVVFFVVSEERRGRVNKPKISGWEAKLISHARKRFGESCLFNRNLPKCEPEEIPGVTTRGNGRPPQAVRDLRRMLDIEVQ